MKKTVFVFLLFFLTGCTTVYNVKVPVISSVIYELTYKIDLPREELCLACLNADYPTKYGKILYNVALKNADTGAVGRTYEGKKI